MTTRDEPWNPGTPCWVDIMTPQRSASWAFYRQVFGWTIEDSGPDMGHYGMARLTGRDVAGIGETPPDRDVPVAWTTYLATDDLETTAARITAGGGVMLTPTMPIGGAGRMAVAADPTGAAFGLWEADDMIGCGLVNEPGAVVWNELITRDVDRARDFYAAVFEYAYTPMAGDVDYVTIDGDGPGDTIGGMGALAADAPEEIPSHWMVYFQVADADDAAAAVEAAGGSIQVKPHDSSAGRIAVVSDPQGGVFSIIQART